MEDALHVIGRLSAVGPTLEAMRHSLLLAAALMLPASPALARVTFGDHDVRTIFYISKSDDRNRVDYGIRLTAQCQPDGDEPVYAYWHRFEPRQSPFGDLRGLDRRAYGIRRQTVSSRASNGSWIEMRIRGFSRERILILVQRGSDGTCHARAQVRIDDRDAFLHHIFIQLAGPMRIQNVTLEGTDVQSGSPLRETRRPPRTGLPRLGG